MKRVFKSNNSQYNAKDFCLKQTAFKQKFLFEIFQSTTTTRVKRTEIKNL